MDKENVQQNVLELKVITTRVCSEIRSEVGEVDGVSCVKGALIVPCGGGTALEVCLFLPIKIYHGIWSFAICMGCPQSPLLSSLLEFWKK